PLTIRKHGSYTPPMAATAVFRSSSRNLQITTACLKPGRLRQERGTWRSISRQKRYSCHYPTASPHRRPRHKPRIPEASSHPEPSGFLSLACRNHGHVARSADRLVDRPDCYRTLSLLLSCGDVTEPGGRVGTVAKFAGSSPVRLSRNATMSLVSASPSVTPSCTRAMTRTACGIVATDPS